MAMRADRDPNVPFLTAGRSADELTLDLPLVVSDDDGRTDRGRCIGAQHEVGH